MLPPANPFSRFAKTSAKKKEMQPNGDDVQSFTPDNPAEEAAESPSFERAEERGLKAKKKK